MSNPQPDENEFVSNRFDYIGSPYEDAFMTVKKSDQEWVDVYGVSYFWGEIILFNEDEREPEDDDSMDDNDALGEP